MNTNVNLQTNMLLLFCAVFYFYVLQYSTLYDINPHPASLFCICRLRPRAYEAMVLMLGKTVCTEAALHQRHLCELEIKQKCVILLFEHLLLVKV
jgi:hypothetical protein